MLKEILRYRFCRTDIVVPYLIFFVTSKCNFRCPNCFNIKNLGDGRRDLTLDEIGRLAPTLGRLLWLSFSGGEPFLRNDLAEIATLLYRHTHFRRFNIPTNGFLTDRIVEVTQKMLPKIDCDFSVTVSIDGLGDQHDQMKGVPGSFEAATATILRLRELQQRYRHLSVKVNTVISNRNVDTISVLAEHVRKTLAPDFHAFELVRAQPLESPIQPPSIEACARVYEQVQSIWRLYDQYERNQSRFVNQLAMGLYRYLHEVHLESMSRQVQAVPCLAGKVSGVIYEDGRVGVCEMLPAIGNLRDVALDFRAIWTSENAERQRHMVRSGGCHCTHTCFQFTSVLFNPRLYGRILRSAFSA